MQGVVPKFSATPGAVRLAGCRPGQHNDGIYGDLLGMSRQEITRLHDIGAI
jgi:formyl-CoA transferase